MFKNFEEETQLILESSDNSKYFEHYCDDQFLMYQYKKDRTFNEMRRDVYFCMYMSGYEGYDKIVAELTEFYTETKNELKQKNKSLHELFLNNKTHKIIKLVNDFDILSVVDIPKAFNKTVLNARIIDYNGNSMCLLCCDDMYFYVLDWGGS